MNQTVQKFIDELKGKRPYLTTDTQVLIGRVVLTAAPDLHAEEFTKLSIEIPRDFALDEMPCFYLFVMAVFGSECIFPFQPPINNLIRHGQGSQTKVDGLYFKAVVRGENCVMTVEPIRPSS
jgi:hypothetical protein